MDRRDSERLDCDVLIIGGGAAGVAVAATAARRGCKVILVERYGFCGGGAVAGLSGTVCGLYAASRTRSQAPQQVVFGFADEFIRRLDAGNGLGPPLCYGNTYTRVHDPLVWRNVADAILSEAGVSILYHAIAIGVLMDGGEKVDGVELWTKQGRVDVYATITVDASGDADIVAMAGLPSFIGDAAGRVQNPTMIFRLMGVDVARFRRAYGPDTIMGEEIGALIRAKQAAGAYALPRSHIWLFPTPRPHELLCNCTRVVASDGSELNVLRHRDFTAAEIIGRRQAHEYARFFRAYLKGCENAFVNDTGVQVGVRQTRQVEGVATLANADVLAARKCADGIARSPWPIELHAGAKPKLEWIFDDYCEVPFGCFVPAQGEGLLVAGRCLSAEHEALASARVTAQCFSYGHAIGHAAALAALDGVAPRAIDGRDVRALLNRDGAGLH